MIYNQSIRVKNKEFRNRYIVAPVKTAYASLEGEVNSRHLNYYKNLAVGGAGMIIIEPVSVSQSGKEHPKQLNIHKDDSVKNLLKISNIIKLHGSIPAINLNHAGRGANKMATKMTPKAPSVIVCPMSGLEPEELSIDDIDEIIEDYKTAIFRAKEAGFEAIELQCGHGYLIHQFLSSRLNKREDIYGQDKTLFLKKILELFKDSDEIIKIIRISGSEFVEGGWSPRDNKVIFDLAQEYGFDMVHCGFGNVCDTPPWYYSHMAVPESKQKEVVKAIKSMCELPLIVVGRMASKDKIKEYEEESLADFIAFGRPVVADPSIVNKLVNLDYNSIDYCGYCLQGCLANVKAGKGLGCIINPTIDKEEIPLTKSKKRFAVIGAGPAGISASLTLIKLGHSVTLFEKEESLGGNFVTAPKAIGKESMKRPLASLINKCKKDIKDIRINCDIKKEDLSKYDHFFVATGSHQRMLNIKGIESAYVISSLDYFHGKKEVKGKRVLILGAGMVGIEAAENLSKKGFDVTVTKRGEEIGNDMEMITKKLLLKRLENSPLKIMLKTEILSFDKDGVTCKQNGEDKKLDLFDTVMIAVGLESDENTAEFLIESGKNITLIGDSKKVSNIYEATKMGYEEAIKML